MIPPLDKTGNSLATGAFASQILAANCRGSSAAGCLNGGAAPPKEVAVVARCY